MTELERAVADRIKWFQSRGDGMMSPMMVNEAAHQFIHMAQGGDGSAAECGEIRNRYYEGRPDRFFQLVCEGMGWNWDWDGQ